MRFFPTKSRPRPGLWAIIITMSALMSCGGPLVPFDISITPPRDGLVGEWLLDGDYSDSANPSTITTVNDPSNSFAVDRFGTGKALSLNLPGGPNWAYKGTNNKIRFYYTDTFTISVWAKTSMTNFTADYDIAGFDTNGGPGGFYATMAYRTGTTKLSTFMSVNGYIGSDITPGINVSNSRWQHFVMVYQKSRVKVYNNGIYEDSVTFNPPGYSAPYPTLPAFDFRIGVNNGGPNLVALVDDVRVYNRALTGDEIQRLYHEKGYGY